MAEGAVPQTAARPDGLPLPGETRQRRQVGAVGVAEVVQGRPVLIIIRGRAVIRHYDLFLL